MGEIRAKRHAEAFAASLAERVGEHGAWIIYTGDGSWYGFYSSRAQARDRLGLRDSLGFTIRGTIAQLP